MSFEAVMPPYNAGDPTATFLSASCLDFLLIELVPMAYRVTNELEASASSAQGGTLAAAAAATEKDVSSAVPRAAMDEEEERDAVFYRLETLGYRVGQGLVERYVSFPHGMLCVVWCVVMRGGSLSVGVVAVPACLPAPLHTTTVTRNHPREKWEHELTSHLSAAASRGTARALMTPST
jgi:hypothetical protein